MDSSAYRQLAFIAHQLHTTHTELALCFAAGGQKNLISQAQVGQAVQELHIHSGNVDVLQQ